MFIFYSEEKVIRRGKKRKENSTTMSITNATKPLIKTINGVKKNRLTITNFHHPISLGPAQNVEEDPFENAMKENAKLEAKSDEKRLMLKLFEMKLKRRLKEYKSINNQMEEDRQLKIEKSNEPKEFERIKKKLIDSSTRSIALETNPQSTDTESKRACSSAIKNLELKLQRSLSMASLPSSLLRSLQNDEKLNEEKSKSEFKKRIISTRKIYSNNERELVRKHQYQQQQQLAVKKEKSKKLEEKQSKFVNKPQVEIINMKAVSEEVIKSNEIVHRETLHTQQVFSQNIDRYINYLKQLLKDRAKQFRLEIPPLCQCSQGQIQNELWDIDWNTCANNCLFYKNPKGNFLFFFEKFFIYFKNKLKKKNTLRFLSIW